MVRVSPDAVLGVAANYKPWHLALRDTTKPMRVKDV